MLQEHKMEKIPTYITKVNNQSLTQKVKNIPKEKKSTHTIILKAKWNDVVKCDCISGFF